MRFDYHMHLEYGSYDEDYAEGFFRAAAERGVDEIGFSEHAHTFPEFEQLYYDDLILDDSFVGAFQRKWLKTNKFKYTLDEYFSFIEKLRKKHKVLAGIEVCNFQDQEAAAKILRAYPFDYIIGSVHFLRGWAYDTAAIKAEWDNHPLTDIYEWYGGSGKTRGVRALRCARTSVQHPPLSVFPRFRCDAVPCACSACNEGCGHDRRPQYGDVLPLSDRGVLAVSGFHAHGARV